MTTKKSASPTYHLPSATYLIMQVVAMLALIVGLAGPWIYGTLGKNREFGWQPVISAITLIIPTFMLLVGAIVNCFCYLELTYKMGRPVLEGVLKWVGAFFVMVVVIPLVVWLTFDFTGRSSIPTTSENSLGWGVWVTLGGLILQVIALRWRIRSL